MEAKEIKSGVDEIKMEIILDKESRENWLSEIRNEVKSLIKFKENPGSIHETFNLESKECQDLIDALSLKIYEKMIRWANKKLMQTVQEGK